MESQRMLLQTMVELADTLVNDFDVVDLLTRLTDRCVEAFNVTDAGLMLAAPMGADLQVMASSSAAMREMELYEIQSSDGPCLDCYRSHEPVINQDLAASVDRWPRFAPAALDAGFESVSALPMRLRSTTIGALNLFLTRPGALDEHEVAAAQAFADVATIAILQHQATSDARTVNEQLNFALNSRVIIEQAKGMLAERANIELAGAFDLLRRHARSHNLRLAVLSQDFIEGRVTIDSIARSADA